MFYDSKMDIHKSDRFNDLPFIYKVIPKYGYKRDVYETIIKSKRFVYIQKRNGSF